MDESRYRILVRPIKGKIRAVLLTHLDLTETGKALHLCIGRGDGGTVEEAMVNLAERMYAEMLT